MRRVLGRGALAATVVVALTLAITLLVKRPSDVPQDKPAPAKGPAPTPTLYCEFYNFMHTATVVSFLFAVDRAAGGDLRFSEMALVEWDATRTEFEPDNRPQWTRSTEDDVPTLASPDGATRIVLYGFKPGQPGTFWTEAGVRSDTYKNLEGRCRQANFATTQG